MSALTGDLTWADIQRWEGDRWAPGLDFCECGGVLNDTLHDPATGELIGHACERCERLYDLIGIEITPLEVQR